MIVKEFYKTRSDGEKLYIFHSKNGYKIKQVETGNIYDEAIDVEGANYTYVETDEPIEKENETELKAKAYDIITGEVE